MRNMKPNLRGTPETGIPGKKKGFIPNGSPLHTVAAKAAVKLAPAHLRKDGLPLQDMARSRAAQHGQRAGGQGWDGQ